MANFTVTSEILASVAEDAAAVTNNFGILAEHLCKVNLPEEAQLAITDLKDIVADLSITVNLLCADAFSFAAKAERLQA